MPPIIEVRRRPLTTFWTPIQGRFIFEADRPGFYVIEVDESIIDPDLIDSVIKHEIQHCLQMYHKRLSINREGSIVWNNSIIYRDWQKIPHNLRPWEAEAIKASKSKKKISLPDAFFTSAANTYQIALPKANLLEG